MKSGFVIVCIAVSMLILSCNSQQYLTLHGDGSGLCTFSMKLEKPVVDYFLDIAEVSGLAPSRETAVIFDTNAIEKTLTQYEGVKVLALNATHEGALNLSFTFQNIDAIIKANELAMKRNILRFKHGEPNTISLHLDRGSVNDILTTLLNVKLSQYDYLFPRENETKQEYYDNLNFALDSGALLLQNSSISFFITVDGAVIDHNGVLQKPATVQFSVPLDTLLFLSAPLDYYVVFK